MRDFFIFIGALLMCISAAAGGYRLGHDGGYKQGQFAARFECEQAKTTAVDEAVRTTAVR